MPQGTVCTAVSRRGNVKKTRRVELQIEHREISIFAAPGGNIPNWPSPTSPEGSGLRHTKIETCPTCGSYEMLLLTEAISPTGAGLANLQHGMEAGTVHLHCSPSGEWWICTQSIHRS
jgi:hypothetical protein